MSVIHDKSIMPFGVHSGKKMIEVPDDYLIWIYKNKKATKDILDYVEDTFDETLLK